MALRARIGLGNGRWGVLIGAAIALGGCGDKPPSKLPADLPPPEYEKPRGFDLPSEKPATGTPSAAPSTPSLAPSAAAAVSSAKAPASPVK